MRAVSRQLASEGTGTALLLAIVVGSGIMAERLSGGNVAVALLANTLATVFGLYVLIELFGPVSGAHLNPIVSLAEAVRGSLPWTAAGPYVLAQMGGATLGTWIAHAMFAVPILQVSSTVRGGMGQWIAECVATFGLLLVVLRAPPGRAATMVASFVGAAYWFTSSTSFANPAAAWGRMLSDSFAGIAPSSVPAFVAAELIGAVLALGFSSALDGARSPRHPDPITVANHLPSDHV